MFHCVDAKACNTLTLPTLPSPYVDKNTKSHENELDKSARRAIIPFEPHLLNMEFKRGYSATTIRN